MLGMMAPPPAADRLEAADFPVTHAAGDRQAQRRAHLLEAVSVGLAAFPGGGAHVVEFGVWRGRSLEWIAEAVAPETVTGFDDFAKGLPENWERGTRAKPDTMPAGSFAAGPPQAMPANVELIDGPFAETVFPWCGAQPGPLACAHVDCDLRSSAELVLRALWCNLAVGSVLVFDELVDWGEIDGRPRASRYPNWRAGEWAALNGFLARSGIVVAPISRTRDGEAAAVQVRSLRCG